MSQPEMFCWQCEQTAKGTGCTTFGVCGKTPQTARLQDLLVYTLRGLSEVALEARKIGIKDEKTDLLISEALFATLTNVNFDPDSIIHYLKSVVETREALKQKVTAASGKIMWDAAASLPLAPSLEGMVNQGKLYGIDAGDAPNADLKGAQSLLTFGLKGIAAYAYHAYRLNQKDDAVFQFLEEALASTLNPALDLNAFIGLCLKCGEVNIRAMELLDAGNTQTYGNPIPTKVPLGHKKGKAILVSGHDLKDLQEILKQTHDKDITIYTHGEMLPAHGYPELKKYPHFYGHYGTAWQNQIREFPAFPGAILMTTNCIQKPAETYKANIFTSGPVGWPNVTHLPNEDFSPVIEKALALPGFPDDVETKTVLVGFARNTVKRR